MGLLGDFAKGFLILVGIYCIYIIIIFALMGYTEIALLFLITFTVPIAVIAREYMKNKKKKEK